jgi:hypothetical protein
METIVIQDLIVGFWNTDSPAPVQQGQTLVDLGNISIDPSPDMHYIYQYNASSNTISLRTTPLTQTAYEAMLTTDPSTWAAIIAADAVQTQYSAALSAGCQIVSTSTPAINGTYMLDQNSFILTMGEQSYILLKGTFTNGQTTRNWNDVNGVQHTFPSTALFTAFGEVLAQYVDQLQTALAAGLAGGIWTPPAQPVTIS